MGNSLPAVDLGRDQKAISVAAGFFHTCAMLYTGVVKCWGEFFIFFIFFRVVFIFAFPRAFFRVLVRPCMPAYNVQTLRFPPRRAQLLLFLLLLSRQALGKLVCVLPGTS